MKKLGRENIYAVDSQKHTVVSCFSYSTEVFYCNLKSNIWISLQLHCKILFMKALSNFINSQVRIEKKDLEVILSHFEKRMVPKGKFAMKQGRLAKEYYFVISGGLRVHHRVRDKEITAWVALENTILADLISIKSGKPSRFSFQAIEATELFVIKAGKMEELYSRFPQWQQFGRLIWEEAFVNILEGILQFQSLPAAKRYSEMIPADLLNRVPLKQIASFLGVTPSSLSRLRKNTR